MFYWQQIAKICSDYQEQLLKVHFLVHSVQSKKFTADEIAAAVIKTGIDPKRLYYELCANIRTQHLIEFAEALGLPENALYNERASKDRVALYLEAIGSTDDAIRKMAEEAALVSSRSVEDTENALSAYAAQVAFSAGMKKIEAMAGHAQEELGVISIALLKMGTLSGQRRKRSKRMKRGRR